VQEGSEEKVGRLRKNICGLEQISRYRCWNERLDKVLKGAGFTSWKQWDKQTVTIRNYSHIPALRANFNSEVMSRLKCKIYLEDLLKIS